MTWYLDCYCFGAACGKEFPVNSYFSESLEEILEAVKKILSDKITGIDGVNIGKERK